MAGPARLLALPRSWSHSSGLVRGAWFLLLALDVGLLVSLAHAPLVLAGLAGAAAACVAALHLPVAVALLGVGYPLLDPISIATHEEAIAFYIVRGIAVLGLALLILFRLRSPARWLGRLAGDPIFLSALLLGAILAAGLFWTSSPLYGRMKVTAYAITDMLLFAGAYAVAAPRSGDAEFAADRRSDAMHRSIALFALLIAVSGLLNLWIRYYEFESRLTVLGINPIWLARTMGLGLLALIALRSAGRIRLGTAIATGIPLAVVMVLSGSRGPLLGIVLVLALRTFVLTRVSAGRKIALAAAGVAAIGLLVLVMPAEVRERFFQPISREASGIVRLRLLEVVGSALALMPGLGAGTGGFSELLRMGDQRFYPHNIFAELGIENGIPGLAAFVLFLAFILSRGVRRRGDPRVLAALVAFLFAFWNAQFSGDLLSNEWIWLFAGLIAGRTRA